MTPRLRIVDVGVVVTVLLNTYCFPALYDAALEAWSQETWSGSRRHRVCGWLGPPRNASRISQNVHPYFGHQR